MPDKKGDTGYFLTGKGKKLETESVVLLETFNSWFSSEYHKCNEKSLNFGQICNLACVR